MSEYSDEDYTLTETQCEERCDELRSQLDEANKIIESLGQESDHFCKQADKLRSQVARLEGELAQARGDTERLDWLESNATSVFIEGGEEMWCKDPDTPDWDLRSDIDRARKSK